MMGFFKRYSLFLFLGVALILAGLAVGGTELYQHRLTASITTPAPEDPHAAFLAEVREKIKTNYWDKITDEQLDELFRLATEKLNEKGITDKKEFTTQLANIVLANLKPFGRSGLMTEKQQQSLLDTVSNIDRSKDLYHDLGVSKSASLEDIKKAYDSQPKTETSTEAFKVLTNEQTKQRYDKAGALPTVNSHLVSPTVAYIKLDKFSPQTFDEFVATANSITDTPGLDSLILDLRDNTGGAVDLLQYFLGPFIGPGQYAYEFWHQGDLTPYKTKTGWLDSLVKYKKVVVLVDGTTQSSAEVMATTLKKYNVGVLVGATTKGWGTIEQLFPLEHQVDGAQKYSMILVQSITLREDGQPIESRGVEPLIKITDKNWQQQLLSYFNYPPLIAAVKKVW